jgi:hypothetical protein
MPILVSTSEPQRLYPTLSSQELTSALTILILEVNTTRTLFITTKSRELTPNSASKILEILLNQFKKATTTTTHTSEWLV